MANSSSDSSQIPAQLDSVALQARVQELESEMADFWLLHETTIDHGTTLENELIDLVETLTRVARDLEEGQFDPQTLSGLVDRPDELGELGRVFQQMGDEVSARDRRLRMLRVVIPAGVALSAEKDFNRLLETLLIEAQRLCHADGGMLYLLTEEQSLRAVIARCDSLNIAQGGVQSGSQRGVVEFGDRPLYDENGAPNHRDVTAYAALTHQRVNIPDAYVAQEFDFQWVRDFDAHLGYHSQSFLTIPLTDQDEDVIGVLQLINATDTDTGQLIPFTVDDVVETLVLLASAALSSYRREEHLRQEISRLQIQIDTERQAQQVSEITDSEFFQDLQARANTMRKRSRR